MIKVTLQGIRASGVKLMRARVTPAVRDMGTNTNNSRLSSTIKSRTQQKLASQNEGLEGGCIRVSVIEFMDDWMHIQSSLLCTQNCPTKVACCTIALVAIIGLNNFEGNRLGLDDICFLLTSQCPADLQAPVLAVSEALGLLLVFSSSPSEISSTSFLAETPTDERHVVMASCNCARSFSSSLSEEASGMSSMAAVSSTPAPSAWELSCWMVRFAFETSWSALASAS